MNPTTQHRLLQITMREYHMGKPVMWIIDESDADEAVNLMFHRHTHMGRNASLGSRIGFRHILYLDGNAVLYVCTLPRVNANVLAGMDFTGLQVLVPGGPDRVGPDVWRLLQDKNLETQDARLLVYSGDHDVWLNTPQPYNQFVLGRDKALLRDGALGEVNADKRVLRSHPVFKELSDDFRKRSDDNALALEAALRPVFVDPDTDVYTEAENLAQTADAVSEPKSFREDGRLGRVTIDRYNMLKSGPAWLAEAMEGAFVLESSIDWETGDWSGLVWHPLFDRVEPYCRVPEYAGVVTEEGVVFNLAIEPTTNTSLRALLLPCKVKKVDANGN